MPFIDSNGVRIHYELLGEGEPLLLIMGLGADLSAWSEHVNVYARHYRCILVDNRGAGKSDKPPGPYRTEEMAQDCANLLDALDTPAAHVSGISMGGAIAQQLALIHPHKVKSLTLNCTWSACDPYMERTFELLRGAYEHAEPAYFQRLLQWVIFSPEHFRHYLDDLLHREQQGLANTNPMPVHAFGAQCEACTSHVTAGQLHRIQAPTLITVGDQDRFTPLSCSEQIASEIPHAELLIFRGGGHTHHWEQLAEFNAATLDFLKQNRFSSDERGHSQ